MKIIRFKKTRDFKFAKLINHYTYLIFHRYFQKKLKLLYKILLSFSNIIIMLITAHKKYFYYTHFKHKKFQKLREKFKKIYKVSTNRY